MLFFHQVPHECVSLPTPGRIQEVSSQDSPRAAPASRLNLFADAAFVWLQALLQKQNSVMIKTKQNRETD